MFEGEETESKLGFLCASGGCKATADRETHFDTLIKETSSAFLH